MVAFEVIEADLTAAGLRRGIAAPEHKRAGCPEHTFAATNPCGGHFFLLSTGEEAIPGLACVSAGRILMEMESIAVPLPSGRHSHR